VVSAPTSDFADNSGQFMSEHRWRNDHFCVITALENFEIGAASERGLDLDAHLAGFQGQGLDLLDADQFLAVEDGGFHFL
jgi:hypothetical protein